MVTQHFSIAAETDASGNQAVMVPLNRRALVPMQRDRIWRLRKHLVQSLRAMRTMRRPVESASPLRPEPEGFIGTLARAACTLCKGWCCKGGGEHGYMDERVMARVRQARPHLDARAVIRLYTERVPTSSYADSCIFHAKTGCTLDRSLRSDVCNSYFCTGLGNLVKTAEAPPAAIIVANHDGETRMSPVITP